MRKVLLFSILISLCHAGTAQVVTDDKVQPAKADTAGGMVVYKRDGTVKSKREVKAELKAELDAIERKVVVSTNIALWAPSLKIEGRVSPYVTVGGVLKARLIYFTGGKIDPFVRWYPKGHAPRGFFAQLKGSAGVYHTRVLHGTRIWDWGFTNSFPPLPDTYFQAYGGGIVAGYQFLVGHERRGAIELFGGFQYIYYTIPITSDYLVQKLAIMMPLELGVRFGGAF